MLKLAAAFLLLAGVALPAASLRHLTLVDSTPREGAVVTDAPKEIRLKFNEALDSARRAVSLRGPAGPVAVEPVRTIDSLSFAVGIKGVLSPGRYTVSWIAGAPAHSSIRGRFAFDVAGR